MWWTRPEHYSAAQFWLRSLKTSNRAESTQPKQVPNKQKGLLSSEHYRRIPCDKLTVIRNVHIYARLLKSSNENVASIKVGTKQTMETNRKTPGRIWIRKKNTQPPTTPFLQKFFSPFEILKYAFRTKRGRPCWNLTQTCTQKGGFFIISYAARRPTPSPSRLLACF